MIDNTKPTVVWDWNGTLINDTDICITAMNSLLARRELTLLTWEKYRDIFTFPVKDYYAKVGFDFAKEPFEKPALEFIDHYIELLPKANLFPSVADVLQKVKAKGMNQVILSAMEEEALLKSVEDLGISKYFDVIAGITDHFAKSKIFRGQQLIQQFGLKNANMVFVGDTLHDKEVADELGCSCILVSGGHQSESRLKVNGNTVTSNLQGAYLLVENLLEIN